jgi:hypothetical protein
MARPSHGGLHMGLRFTGPAWQPHVPGTTKNRMGTCPRSIQPSLGMGPPQPMSWSTPAVQPCGYSRRLNISCNLPTYLVTNLYDLYWTFSLQGLIWVWPEAGALAELEASTVPLNIMPELSEVRLRGVSYTSQRFHGRKYD